MRLWHQALITKLPRQQLLGLHREVCALRGKGWGKKHSTIDYIKKYSFAKLLAYHCLVIDEMQKRGYHVEENRDKPSYRGKQIGLDINIAITSAEMFHEVFIIQAGNMIYPEHDDAYLQECLQNLEKKGIIIV